MPNTLTVTWEDLDGLVARPATAVDRDHRVTGLDARAVDDASRRHRRLTRGRISVGRPQGARTRRRHPGPAAD